ncbi:MAG TPA: hypothetical protein VLB90_03410, partial [Pseudomonadales bacterium]|nr:hypothetical protein [Pseudomonadales bacterium]
MNNLHRKMSLPVLGVMAVMIVGLIFPDVIFFNRTLQPSNILPHMGRPAEWQASSAILPVFNPEAIASDGFADLNGSAWQSEPARYWIARNLKEGQSPWWNPYSASGTLGPEILVDIKFSLHTLISAWLFDASPASFDFGLLITDCIGVFFILLILQRIFKLNGLAAVAGAFVYLLNGFALPNINTNVGQPYFLFPVLLFAVLFFIQKESIWRWTLLVFAHALLLVACFMPVLVLVFLSVHLIGFSFFVSCRSNKESISVFLLSRYIVMVFSAFIAAVLLEGVLWFPVINSFFITDMVRDFDNRILPKPRSMENFLSVFTPRHFWENYSHVARSEIYPGAGLEKNQSLVAHTGIVAAVLASYAFCLKGKQWSLLVWLCLFLFLFPYARIFGFADFVSYLPIMRSIGNQYWGGMSAIALFVLVAFGIQNIRSGNTSSLPAVVVLLLQVIAFGLLYNKLGFSVTAPYRLYIYVAIFLFLVTGLSVLII